MYELATEEVNPQRKATEFIGSIGKAIYSLIETILVALVLAIVLYLFIMTPHLCNGTYNLLRNLGLLKN